MARIRNIAIGVGAVAALAYGATYLLKLNRLSAELETMTKINIHRVTLDGIELRIDVTLKNPSGGSINVKHPFVKMMYKGSTIASSQVKDVNILIPKFSEVTMEPVMIKLGFISLATQVPALLNEYRSSGMMTLEVRTVTTINDSFPYSKTDTLNIGGGKQA
ncbi:hypothetical protein KK083_21430 [Fulvivirgaceae bacterium PWU4]|uniref:Uncharacterized protein n=1 Tax=Chryseosolibacter histidini TaxID=2782349 RepID=A0AAP2GKV9_9BACT|nr:hypothetical protein [Chryseosolibacter histidini]MBT1699474.1 hypothetical protein [Chryseosolibacter histidini]